MEIRSDPRPLTSSHAFLVAAHRAIDPGSELVLLPIRGTIGRRLLPGSCAERMEEQLSVSDW